MRKVVCSMDVGCSESSDIKINTSGFLSLCASSSVGTRENQLYDTQFMHRTFAVGILAALCP